MTSETIASPSPNVARWTIRDWALVTLLALMVGLLLMFMINDPGYADAYYYFNAGQRWAAGDGLTDPYLWNYLYTPDTLPAPSHTYWMPMPSLLAGISMAVGGTSFNVAQLPFMLAFIGIVLLTTWLALQFAESRRQIWLAALLALSSGFYMPYWTTTATFSLYGLFGAAALILLGCGLQKQHWLWWVSSGVACGLAHLTRADGALILAIALFWVIGYFRRNRLLLWRAITGLTAAYILVMLPWFIRNLDAIGSPLPAGGIGTAFLLEYNDIFEYPISWSASEFFDWGFANILTSRGEAFIPNFSTWIAVEGWIVLMPFALYAIWQHRAHPLFQGFWLYAIALHLVMTFVFAFPGYRGGLFHSSTSLLPFWAVSSVIGLDTAVAKFGQWRRWERIGQAQRFINALAVGVAIILSIFALLRFITPPQPAEDVPSLDELAAIIHADSPDTQPVLMMNDPAKWYYETRLTGVTLPDASLDRLPELAARYCLTHLVIDNNVTAAFEPLLEADSVPPPFLEEVQSFFIESKDPTTGDTYTITVRIYRFSQEQIVYAQNCPQTR